MEFIYVISVNLVDIDFSKVIKRITKDINAKNTAERGDLPAKAIKGNVDSFPSFPFLYYDKVPTSHVAEQLKTLEIVEIFRNYEIARKFLNCLN